MRLSIFAVFVAALTGPDTLAQTSTLLRAAHLFDGVSLEAHDGWAVLVRGEKIEAVGPADRITVPANTRTIELPNATLLPGLIDAHTHVLLHPYNEATWDDQVLKEPLALRVCRATNHLRAHPAFRLHDDPRSRHRRGRLRRRRSEAGGRAEDHPRPADARDHAGHRRHRQLCAEGIRSEWRIPQGAEEADGVDSLTRVVRDQIGHGADWIKVYADAAMGGQTIRPTFSLEELKLIVETAKSAGIPVVAHAMTKEGMRRAALAGVETIEHGDDGDIEVFRLMANKGVALCPTLAAAEAMSKYRGWQPGTKPEPPVVEPCATPFKEALEAGVTIVNGSDMGVFAHGDGARELELLVDYGMKPAEALRSATTVAAKATAPRRSARRDQAGTAGRPGRRRGRSDKRNRVR